MIETATVNQRVGAFDERNKSDEPPACHQGWILFENGARREANPFGALMEPPESKKELCRQKRLFWEIKLKQAKAKFDEIYSPLYSFVQANSQTGNHEPPADFDQKLKELKALKEEVKRCKKRLNKANEKWQAHDPAIARAKQKDETRRRCDEALERIKKLRI